MCAAHTDRRAPHLEFGEEVTGKEWLAKHLGEEQRGPGGGAETGSAVSPPEWQTEVLTSRTLSQRKEISLSKEESLPLFFIFPFFLVLLERTVRLGQVGRASLTMFVSCNIFVPSSEKLETFSTENYQKLRSVLWEQERREEEVGEGVGELCVSLMMNLLLGTLLPMQGWPILSTRGPSVPTLITWNHRGLKPNLNMPAFSPSHCISLHKISSLTSACISSLSSHLFYTLLNSWVWGKALMN